MPLDPLSGSARVLRRSAWFLRSRRRAAVIAAGVGAAVFCTAFFLERHFHYEGAGTLPMVAVSDALAGLLAAVLVLRMLFGIMERRRAVFERLRLIAEINHNIRNGLELIQLSAHTSEDQHAVAIIREGVERIERTLREVLGPTGPLGVAPEERSSVIGEVDSRPPRHSTRSDRI